MKDSRGVEVREITPEVLLGHSLNSVEKRYSPKELYISGSMEIPIPGPRVAIVGTRSPSPEGVRTARTLAQELSSRGVVIISGLARGIDTSAHKGAIESGGKTIAILGTPLDKFYPPENEGLQREIMEKFLVISQFKIGMPIQRKNFVIRNRTMALICDASVIVEAGESSGTLSQGWEAIRLGRPLFIHDSVFKNKALSWPEEMIEHGAIRFEEVADVLEQLPSGEFPPEIERS